MVDIIKTLTEKYANIRLNNENAKLKNEINIQKYKFPRKQPSKAPIITNQLENKTQELDCNKQKSNN